MLVWLLTTFVWSEGLVYERQCFVAQGSFRLDVEEGSFTDSEILVMLGENGTGKTTFIRMLAGMLPPDDEERTEVPEFNVSYKPQKISPKFTSTVRRNSSVCRQAHCDHDLHLRVLQQSQIEISFVGGGYNGGHRSWVLDPSGFGFECQLLTLYFRLQQCIS